MKIIDRLLEYRRRKIQFRKEPLEITLNEKHQRDVEEWLENVGLKLDCLQVISGYRILGMNIRNSK
jgi:hypothetical protein